MENYYLIYLANKININKLNSLYDELNAFKIMFNNMFGIYMTVVFTQYFFYIFTSAFSTVLILIKKVSIFYACLGITFILPMIGKFVFIVQMMNGFPVLVIN